jgi:hypothetical protein
MNILNELERPIRYRVNKVLLRSIGLISTFFLVLPISGYISTLDNTPSIVLTRYMM